MKLKRKAKFYFRKKINNWLFVYFFLGCLFVILFLNIFNIKLKPKIEDILVYEVNKSIYDYIFYMFDIDILTNENIMNIISFQKNKDDEIIAVDYNFNMAYEYLSDGMGKLYEDVDKLKIDFAYFDSNKNIFLIPSGMGTGNMFLERMGFKVPCKIDLLNHVNMGFKTKVTNYGVNNILVELYLVIETNNKMIVPYSEHQFGETYEIVLASKVIMGSVPLYYGDTIEKSSAIISS